MESSRVHSINVDVIDEVDDPQMHLFARFGRIFSTLESIKFRRSIERAYKIVGVVKCTANEFVETDVPLMA